MAHKRVEFMGWKNCIEISSGKLKLIVATEIGPRIVGAFFDGSDNLFHIFPETAGQIGGDEWNNYGGHRLWHSPEDKIRTQPTGHTPTVLSSMPISSMTSATSL